MPHSTHPRPASHRTPLGRVAVAAFAVGGVSLPVLLGGTAGASTNEAKSVVVSTITSAKFGKVLTSGKTLYTLKAGKIPCTAACLKVWPALVLPAGVKRATAGAGVSASKLGTMTLASGAHQVTYGGKPLYYFVGDTGTGQVKGNVSDTWGKWSDVVLPKPSGSSSSSGSGSSGSTSGSGGTAF
jgi:predicted lipoprotein with Yx(FWY)xxD motif